MKEKMQALLNAKNAENALRNAESVFPTQIGRKDKTRGPGWTPYKAAERCDIPWPRFQRAMENGEVKFIDFGDQRRITDQEIARIRGLHGLSPTPERPGEPSVEAEPLKPTHESLPKDKPLESLRA